MTTGTPLVTSEEPLHVNDRFATFDFDFESGVKLLFAPGVWEAAYDEATSVVGEGSKPLRARYAARRMTSEDLTDVGREALHTLASKLQVLSDGSDVASSDGAGPASTPN